MAQGIETHFPALLQTTQALEEAISQAAPELRPLLERLLSELKERHDPDRMISSDIRLG
jgi:hypothetical protein